MNNAERWLKLLLLLFGAPPALAVIPFLMPFGWMAAIHEWLGMGLLPDQPIVDYLARYASGFSAFYGFLLLLIRTDVRRYAPVITLQAIAVLVLSAVSSIFAWRAGMPWWWIVGDVLSCWGFCGAMLWLQRKISRPNPGAAADGGRY
jgi:hypothetical protein